MNNTCRVSNLDRLNVVFIVSTLGQTGPTRQILNIIRYLDADSVKASLITLSPESKETLKPEFDVLEIPIYTLGLGQITGLLCGQRALRKLLTQIEPDIIHTQGIRADLLSAGLTGYSSRLTTQRNIPADDYSFLYGRLPGALLAQLHRKALNRIPYRVSCSTLIARDNDDRGATSIVIRNGVDLAWCPELPTKADQLAARNSLNLAQDGQVFIYAGPMIRRKNPVFLVKTFLKWTQRSQHQLWLLGDGPLAEECRQLARDHPNVIVPGHISDIRTYFRAADVFLSASSSEGFPNAVLEALAFGLPLVLSDIPPHREIIEKDPRIGQLFPLGDPSIFSLCLDHVNTDDRVRQAAHRLAESEYSAKTMGQSYMFLYKKINSKARHFQRER